MPKTVTSATAFSLDASPESDLWHQNEERLFKENLLQLVRQNKA